MENNPLKNLWQITDLRNRVLFTLGMLGVYRIGNHIPTPGVNQTALALLAEAQKNTMFGLYDMFSGGNLSKVTIFALGIMPYISSSILLQLPCVGLQYLDAPCTGSVAGAPQDHAGHALPDRRARHRAGAEHCDLPRAPDEPSGWSSARLQ